MSDEQAFATVREEVRLGTAINLARNALMEIAKMQGPEHFATLRERYILNVKNNWIEGLKPDQELIVMQDALGIVEKIFKTAEDALAAGL
jgi:hypothetical protein